MISLICGVLKKNKTETDSSTQTADCWLLYGRGLRRLGEKDEGIKYKTVTDVKYSLGNIVSGTVRCQMDTILTGGLFHRLFKCT